MNDRTCLQCGESLAGRRKDARFCSAPCKARHHDARYAADGRLAAYQARAAERQRPPDWTGQCEQCGLTISGRRVRRYCGQKCASSAYTVSRKARGRSTVPSSERNREREKVERVCVICNRKWRTRRKDARYCSNECRRTTGSWSGRSPAVRRQPVADSLRQEVFERDGYTCWLCGLATSPVFMVGDPKSPTIDHLTPVSKGGTNDPSNLGTAHLFCNVRRGNTTMTSIAPRPEWLAAA